MLVKSAFVQTAVVFFIATTPLQSFAEEKSVLTKEYTECMSSSIDNKHYIKCGAQEIDRQERLLTQVWDEVTNKLVEATTQDDEALLYANLVEEQKAWIKWKDVACQFYIDPYLGREATVLNFPRCKATVIAERIRWLQGIAEDF